MWGRELLRRLMPNPCTWCQARRPLCSSVILAFSSGTSYPEGRPVSRTHPDGRRPGVIWQAPSSDFTGTSSSSSRKFESSSTLESVCLLCSEAPSVLQDWFSYTNTSLGLCFKISSLLRDWNRDALVWHTVIQLSLQSCLLTPRQEAQILFPYAPFPIFQVLLAWNCILLCPLPPN